ncbi:hypothetical protein PTTG_26294 [Puccinia triticina 1-1 BBBD Race 1]|uniref:Uncharacterized protein n=1 Tax=Puccinia triticina (isolate 1-1 / race 1 (BBBD)) TaxID=630390 RepID=A0A180GVZ5_PUCT1|nr:hypothetical protein PTTG_26294 [Puccinia triticina 1-1 BBBD Race 1]
MDPNEQTQVNQGQVPRDESSWLANQSQRLDNLDQQVGRVVSGLEQLISIMKDNNLCQYPPPPASQFNPVCTAFADTPNFARFAFVPNAEVPVLQLQPGKKFLSAGGNPQQGQPIPSPTGNQPVEVAEGQVQNQVYLEPPKIADLWFSGDPRHLARFLQLICDFLYPREAFFSSQARMIVWISRHFGYKPLDSTRAPSPAENWYNSLISTNACAQNVLDPYTNLDRLPQG